jgi:hypothetical protein
MATPTLFTVGGLATELGRDQRLLGRILSSIHPDDASGARPRWRLQTALKAIADYEHRGEVQRANGQRVNARATDGDRCLDDLERITIDLQGALAKLATEPSIKKRRTQATHIGPLVIRFKEALDRSGELLSPNLRELTQAARAEILGEALAEVAALLALDLDRCA